MISLISTEFGPIYLRVCVLSHTIVLLARGLQITWDDIQIDNRRAAKGTTTTIKALNENDKKEKNVQGALRAEFAIIAINQVISSAIDPA